MDTPVPIVEKADLVLDEIVSMGIVIARALFQDVSEAEDRDQRARSAAAWQGVTRSVRQSLALKERLAHLRLRIRKAARAEVLDEAQVVRNQIRSGVRKALGESDDSLTVLARLEIALIAESAEADFLDIPVERHIQRLCRKLGVPVPDTTAPAGEAQPDAPWRSSA